MNVPKPPKCPECGAPLDSSGYPDATGKVVYQCHNMACLSIFDEDDDLGDDPEKRGGVLTVGVLIDEDTGEEIELIEYFDPCGKALEHNDRACALTKGHTGGPCLPASAI